MTAKKNETAGNHAIVVQNLEKVFGNIRAVDGISFSVPFGSTTALLGGNGAGKTTTLSMLLGILYPSAGSIAVLGHDMTNDRYAALERMNFASPFTDLPRRLTVRENLTVYGRLYSVPDLRERIDELAEGFVFTDFLDRHYGKISAGQQARVALAKSLLNKPDVLLLDEPTASLDPDMADKIRSYIEKYRKKTGATILLASHNMPEVERLCDNVLMMRQGKIVDVGAPQTLIHRYGLRNMEDVFLKVARDHGKDKAVAALLQKKKKAAPKKAATKKTAAKRRKG
jgi:ABC-2 type transport system ATP-binding protein